MTKALASKAVELRQLEYFVAVVEEKNFTRAAQRIHVAQPAVSSQIRRLERELGHALLDRSGRSVRLTAAGEVVLPHARAALSAAASTHLAVEELAGLVRGRVSVGMVTLLTAVDVPSLLADFCDRHPKIEITLREADSDVLLASLVDGTLDVAFVGMSTERPPDVVGDVVTDEKLVAAVPTTDPLASRTSVALAELGDRAMICLPRGSGVRAALDQACADRGVRPFVAFEASDPRALLRLAERGFGVAVLPRSIPRAFADHLAVLEIVEPAMTARIELASRASGPISPGAQAIVEFARKAVPPHS